MIRPGCLFIGCLLLLPSLLFAQPGWKTRVAEYLQKLAKPDGGYGWFDQPDSHLTPTYAAIGILNDLQQLPVDHQPLIQFVNTHHPQRGKNREAGPSGTEERDLVYQQIQSIAWLGGTVSNYKPEVLGWKPQDHKTSNFEEHGYPVLLQEMMSPVCRSLLDASRDDIREQYLAYIHSRQRANGSYNNTPATDGGDGNILNTYWALRGILALKSSSRDTSATAHWIRLCQQKNGGFTHQPNPSIGAMDDIAYTWAAVQALKMLGAKPLDIPACIRYIASLRNSDGGFGNKPGWPSTPMATFYAVNALRALDAFVAMEKMKRVSHPAIKAPDLTGMKIFTVQFEAGGTGSPEEAVMLADSLHINLWGCKNSDSAWRTKAQLLARERKVPVIFFQADEAYGKSVAVAGLGRFSHVMDYIAPPAANIKLELDGDSWHRYHESFIKPLKKSRGTLILQVTNNEPLGRIILDESLLQGGFSAISTIHFGQNFSFWLPWLHEYRHRVPFVTLQDAHGTESWWWSEELSNHRTLFLAKEPTYEAMMDALQANRIVALRHDSVSSYKTRMLGGAPGIQDYIRSREADWAWWKNDSLVPSRPWAAITVINTRDSFEVRRSDDGPQLRVRCRWASTRQLLNHPMVRLASLSVDGNRVNPEYILKKNEKGQVMDAYYLLPLPAPGGGSHKIIAVLEMIDTKERREVSTSVKDDKG